MIVLPGMLIVALIAQALRPLTVGLVGAAFASIARTSLTDTDSLAVAGLAVVLLLTARVPGTVVVLLAGAVGAVSVLF